jgi:hypothetical protein
MGNIRKYQKVHRDAVAAGKKAGQEVNASKMIVVQRANPLDDNSPIVQQWDNGGQGFEPCGFAWVVMPGNSGFGRWIVKQGYASKHYGGGVGPWVSEFGQSHERKVAYAQAYADVVNESGILPDGKKAYAEGRLD